MISSGAVVIISFVLFPFFKYMPMVIVASILVFIATNMIEAENFIRRYKQQKSAFFISIFTVILILIEDPMVGILIGSVIALLLFINNMTKGHAEILLWKNRESKKYFSTERSLQHQKNADAIVYRVSGALSYINMITHLAFAQKTEKEKTHHFSTEKLFVLGF